MNVNIRYKSSFIREFISRAGSEEGNVMRYRVIYAACLIIHSFYAILFTCVNVTELAVFNWCSSVMYLSGLIAVRTNRYTKIWLFLMYAEIVSHGILCSVLIGYDYQFTLFSLAIIPVTYFVTFLDPAFRHPIRVSSILALINGTGMIWVLHGSVYAMTKYNAFPPAFICSVATINMTIAIFIMLIFSVMFIAKINHDFKILKDQNDKLDYLAYYDQLTGLRNRNHIHETFEQYLQSKAPYCVILGDIDDFKKVNDTFGHNAGDNVLRKVAEIIRNNVGDRGVVCRWGGEEMLIIIKGTYGSCLDVMGKIHDEIRNTTVESGHHNIKITMTFGMCGHDDAENIEKLISLADKRLYIGKNSGKDRIISES